MTAIDWTTLTLALWGAGLSTTLAVQRQRKRVKLILTPTVVSTGDHRDVHDLWGVRVVHVRERPVEVDRIGLRTDTAKYLHSMKVGVDGQPSPIQLPVVLRDGESVEVFFPAPRGLNEDIPIGAWACDTSGRFHFSRYPPLAPRARWRSWQAQRRWKALKRRNERLRTTYNLGR